MSHLPKHLLVIRLSSLGDVAMTVPVLTALLQKYPTLKITVLTRPFFSPFFRDLPNVSVFSIDEKGKHKGLFGLYKLYKELKKFDIDAVADLHNVLRSKILKLFFLGNSFIQVDKGRKEKKGLISGQKFKQLKPTHQRYVDVFEKLGFFFQLSDPIFPRQQILNEKTLKITQKKDTKKWIGIAPFAQYQSKMYPLDLMKDVIFELSKEHQILLFGGGAKEMEILNEVAQRFENVINIAGKLNLDEELDLISNLDVMLSMDSGNAHMAAMLGVKTITIWGVTHPYAGFAPFQQPIENTLLADRIKFPKIPTSVYGNKYPHSYVNAASTITTISVIKKVTSLLIFVLMFSLF